MKILNFGHALGAKTELALEQARNTVSTATVPSAGPWLLVARFTGSGGIPAHSESIARWDPNLLGFVAEISACPRRILKEAYHQLHAARLVAYKGRRTGSDLPIWEAFPGPHRYVQYADDWRDIGLILHDALTGDPLVLFSDGYCDHVRIDGDKLIHEHEIELRRVCPAVAIGSPRWIPLHAHFAAMPVLARR